MSIHQTKDGRWFVAFREKGSRAVKRKYFGHGPEGKAAAKKFEGDWSLDRQNGRLTKADRPEITFGELAQKYLDARPLTKRSRESIGYALNLHFIPRWGDLPVSSLAMSHLAEVDEALSRAGRSLATRNRYRSYCKTICQWGLSNELIAQNPFARYRPEIKKEGGAPDLVSAEELKAIYNAAPPHLRWAIEVMVNTGLRPGVTELFAVKISDIDFQQGGLWIARSKTRERNKSLLPLRQDFLQKIKDMVDKNPERMYLVEYEGQRVNTLKTAWRTAKRKAGVTRRLRLYELRHWFATNLISGGADIKAASELLGHASPDITISTYYHLLERQKRTALNHLTIPDLSDDNPLPDPPSDKPFDKPKGSKIDCEG